MKETLNSLVPALGNLYSISDYMYITRVHQILETFTSSIIFTENSPRKNVDFYLVF